MTGANVLTEGYMHGFNDNFWEAVPNTSSVYNLPILEALNLGGKLYKITYNTSVGTISDELNVYPNHTVEIAKQTYSIFVKETDNVIIPVMYNSSNTTYPYISLAGHTFHGWVNEDGEAVTSLTSNENHTIEAVWDIIPPVVTLNPSTSPITKTYGETSSLEVKYDTYENINYTIIWYQNSGTTANPTWTKITGATSTDYTITNSGKNITFTTTQKQKD